MYYKLIKIALIKIHHILTPIIALISGLSMALAPAPLNFWPLAWVSLAPLWVLIVELTTKLENQNYSQYSNKNIWNFPIKLLEKLSFKFPIKLSVNFLILPVLWGIGYHGLALSWIFGIYTTNWMGIYWLASLAITCIFWIAISIWGSIFVTIWAIGIALFSQLISKIPKIPSLTSQLNTSLQRILIGTTLWCSLEFIWSNTPLWWSSLSYTQSPSNLVILHLGQISGPATVTAAIVTINGLIAEAWLNLKHISKYNQNNIKNNSRVKIIFLILPIISFIVFHILGFLLYTRPLNEISANALKIGIIQGNIPAKLKVKNNSVRTSLEIYANGYRTLADRGVDAVLTPETALPIIWSDNPSIYNNFYQAILEKNIVAWLGAFGTKNQNYTNSLFTITGDGKKFSQYEKVNLVPFGEYIPFAEILQGIINKIIPWNAGLVPGKINQIFTTPFGSAIVGICYDSAFAEHFRRQAATGGEFIITASNNSYYTAAMPPQHHALDLMRAIETDKWAVRVSNTGYSGFIDPHGKTIWISQLNTYQLHADTIYRRPTKTLYVLWGDRLTPVLFLSGIFIWWQMQKKLKNL